ncbi:MAG TPA: 50S ribosomal protein L15 [Terriglobia bacterium]|nr:50S ribosomal protein L15 [Terriglobia bacterium]
MAIHIGSLRPPRGAHKRRKRIGFGMGSGHGKTATRGSKGQKSRAGSRLRVGFEGGQMPLQRRLPKRGFTNIFRKQYAVVNLGDLAELDLNGPVTPESLVQAGVVKKLYDGLKILGEGDLEKPVTISAHRFSKSALEKIKKAGGTAEVISA